MDRHHRLWRICAFDVLQFLNRALFEAKVDMHSIFLIHRSIWRYFAQIRKSNKMRRGSLLLLTGFVLSPLSWWNDVFVNIPISWLTASLFAQLWPAYFKIMFIACYWITNITGLILMHIGRNDLVQGRGKKMNLLIVATVTVLYTVGVVLLLHQEIIIPLPLQLF